jgi:hypothetical protein
MTRPFLRGLRWRKAGFCGLVACLAALAAPACDKMSLVAPSDTTITLYASSTTVGLNGTVDVTATVIEAAGTPVQNGTVITFTTTLGALDPLEARTSGGKATVKLSTGTKSGTATVNAFSGSSSATTPLSISIGAAAAGSVSLLANPSALPASGGTVQLTAVVNDSSSNRLAGVPVTFTTDGGVLAQTSVTTDGNGEARTSLSTTASAKVTASVIGGSSASALTASLSIPVRVGPTVTISIPSGNLLPGVPAVFSVSVAAGGSLVRSASIDFGDGGVQPVSTSGLSSVSHTYGSSGTYVVTAIATDAAGESTTATASVSVQDVVVAVTLTVSPSTITTSTIVVFSAVATTNPTGGAFEAYEWDFGDGYTRTTSGPSTSHTYSIGGGRRYIATVRAVTKSGAAGTAQVDFIVQ